MKVHPPVHRYAILLAALGLTACASMGNAPSAVFSQTSLPENVKVPVGHKVALESTGAGDITYECRAKKDMADQFEWVFVGPDAKLMNRNGTQIGRYFGPPATWESQDGSKITGTQVAVAPAGSGNIPLQLVKANPGTGAWQGVSYIQRVATQGGLAPALACAPSTAGQKQTVKYQADYIFWRAA